MRVYSENEINTLVGDIGSVIEDATFGDGCWLTVVEEISKKIPGGMAALINQDAVTNSLNYKMQVGLDDFYYNSYVEYYHDINSWMKIWENNPCGLVKTTAEHIPRPRQQCEATEFFQDWLRPQKNYDAGAGVKVSAGSREMLILTVNYPYNLSPSYDGPFTRFLELLSPVFKRNIDFAKEISATSSDSLSRGAVLNRGDAIAFVVDDRMKLREANEAADRAFRKKHPFTCRNSRVELSGAQTSAVIRDRIRKMAAGEAAGADPVTYYDGDGAWLIKIYPLPATRSSRNTPLLEAVPLFLVLAKNIAASEGPGDLPSWKHLFGLTDAEVRLCLKLAAGLTLKDAADQTGVTFETARHRLKTIFRKTEISRQSELIAMIERSRM